MTIPTALKREYGISRGDVFLVEVESNESEVVVRYERIHEANTKEKKDEFDQ